MTKINETNLTRKFEEDLIIFGSPFIPNHKEMPTLEKYRLFKEMNKLSIFERKGIRDTQRI